MTVAFPLADALSLILKSSLSRLKITLEALWTSSRITSNPVDGFIGDGPEWAE